MRLGAKPHLGGAAVLGAVLATALPAAGAGSLFQPYTATALPADAEAVAIGDVSGDGRNDVVVTTGFAEPGVWVFLQAADGALAAPVSYPAAGTRPESVAIGDLTGDGRKDVVVGLLGTGIQVFPQTAAGALGPSTTTESAHAGEISLGRLDGDADLDVAGVGWGTNTVAVFLNDGAGGLAAPVLYPAEHAGYEDLEVADVTGDARDDIVVMSGQTYAVPNISVVAQLPAGGFAPPATYRVGANVNTNGIGVGDVTGDGRTDVVATYGGNKPSSYVAVFAQSAAGTLAAPVSYPSYDIPEPVEVADLDFDGRADVVTLHGGWNQAGVYRQQAGGALAAEELYPIPYASHYNGKGLAVGDVNGDGSADVAIADYNQGLVVLRNTLTPPPPPADLAVDVTAPSSRVKPKAKFSFGTVVTNAGPGPSTATLVVTLTGPASGIAAPGCSTSGVTVTCVFPGMAPGSSRSAQITGTATAKGTVAASAVVSGSALDGNAANDRDSASIQVR